MPEFVRVKDKSTKHQFDVPVTDPRIGKAFELVDSDRYPRASNPRPAKHHVPRSAATADEQGPSEGTESSDETATASADATETPESKPARANTRK